MAVNAAPLAMAMHKRLLWQGLDMSLKSLAAKASRSLNYTMSLPDAVEGGMAWFEKRPPRWQGQLNDNWPEWMS